jgi:septal ring factor EnvC (AmiA/AmiB activator)
MTVRGWYTLLPVLLFLGLAAAGHCQPAATPDLPSSQTSTETALQSLLVNLQTLTKLLEERKIALETARRQLSELQTELETLRARLTTSQQEIARLTVLLRQSDETLSALQTSFDAYQRACRRATWMAGIGGGLLGLLLGIIGTLTVV